MASYSFPDSFEDLQKPAADFISGLAAQESVIGNVQITAAILQADLDRAAVLDGEYEAIVAQRTNSLQLAQRTADAEGRKFIGHSKKVLAVHLGDQWSERWGQAGFKDTTTQTPSTLLGRANVIKELASYFTIHADQATPALSVTAARAQQLHVALTKAIADIKDHGIRRKAAKGARDKAITVLRKRLRSSIAELDLLLEGDSTLWNGLGLTPPATKSRRASKKSPAIDSAPARSTNPASATEVAETGVALAK